ncbi:histidine kinase [Lucifera butyrica]|uniref:histidine kinase n=1 Tax=Lucifera butyrica TaxID=1351585 RepID=A0A498RAH1_9FIRM|nr:sensor histidine kinase [Lucifera butyrica]VBB09706.1 histidine kinase [Lucifera butyrica]
MNQKNLYLIRMLMLLLNIVIILFMSSIIYEATERICDHYMARDFLEKIKFTPIAPWKVPAFSLSLLALLILTVIFRERFWGHSKPVLYLFSIADILFCIAIMYCLNMSYKGVILLSIANIIVYIDRDRKKYLLVILSVLVYILFDYDIFSIKLNLFSLNDYIQYYTSAQRLYIFGIRNVLISLNEVLFILFMMIVIQNQVNEKMKIKELYDKLYQTAEESKIANIQLQEYSRKVEAMAKTRERNRLAREIHDTIGHTLTGIATGLEACSEIIDRDLEKTKSQIQKIAELAKKGLLEIRKSVSALRPDATERLSLISSLQKLADDITECTRTKVNFRVEGEVRKLWVDEEETAYRFIQEGITNAVRHGKAKEITIHFRFEPNAVKIEIQDDGVGCAVFEEGFGLTHLREMVEMLNGTAGFFSQSGAGFTMQARLPVRGR